MKRLDCFDSHGELLLIMTGGGRTLRDARRVNIRRREFKRENMKMYNYVSIDRNGGRKNGI